MEQVYLDCMRIARGAISSDDAESIAHHADILFRQMMDTIFEYRERQDAIDQRRMDVFAIHQAYKNVGQEVPPLESVSESDLTNAAVNQINKNRA